ncbi:MAG: hypothetical protein AAF716_23410 [Cyanobacteria bacterium P01_D01_bin.1]
MALVSLLLLLFSFSTVAKAQLPFLESRNEQPAIASPTSLPLSLPVQIARQEDLPTQPVYFDGRTLFEVAAVEDLPLQQRVREIEARLYAIAPAPDEPVPEVQWEVEPSSNQPVLYVGETLLMTVTVRDTRLGDAPTGELRAQALSLTLQTALERYHQDRQPQALRRQLWWFGLGVPGLITVSWGLFRGQQHMKRRRSRLNLGTETTEGLTRWQQWARSWLLLRALPNWGYRLLQLTLWLDCC